VIISRARSASFGGFTVLQVTPGAFDLIGDLLAKYCPSPIDTTQRPCPIIQQGSSCVCLDDLGCPPELNDSLTSTV